MGYYMRFFDTGELELSLSLIEAQLQKDHPDYRIEPSDTSALEGELYRENELFAAIEINVPGDGLFEDEIGEAIEELEDCGEGDHDFVLGVLQKAKRTIAVQVLYQGRELEPTLQGIDPLFDTLHAMGDGLLQADGEGYFDEHGLVLAARP